MFEEHKPRPELLRYGYAPGNYMITCRFCDKTASGVDKRAIRCEQCAMQAMREETTENSYFPLRIEYLDTGSTAIVYSPDAIPSARSFKVLETKYNG